MCTSVPQTPARRTRIRTSSSRMVGSGTFLRTKPGAAAAFTSAFTRVLLQVICECAVARRERCVGAAHETSHGANIEGSVRVARETPVLARLVVQLLNNTCDAQFAFDDIDETPGDH